MEMARASINPVVKAAISTGSVIIVALVLTGCTSAEEERSSNLYQDGRTCSDFGVRYGSRPHTGCMLQQQDRRDREQLMNMERARISSEQARNNLEMLREIRRRRGEY